MANRTSATNKTHVGKYVFGKTLGEGSFAKVKFARNIETEENVAIKIVDKEKVLKHKMIGQIKREISTMKLIRHPNVIRMYEVMASKTKIYIVLEFITGGELFNKIASRGRLKEDEARKYFQQLINAVDYCHSRGVYHRDLKPENLLLDANGVLKVSDFGLSALPQQVGDDGLLHTTCGTPNYVAPEVINNKGYNGAKADLWSCGVILFVLMAGYLPFEDPNLMGLYKKIFKADFNCPPWFSTSAKKLIKRILDPNPLTRITIAEIIENEWFKKGYMQPKFEQADVSLDDVDAIFNELGDSQNFVVEQREEGSVVPATMNAFELISTSQGLNLGSLFEKQMGLVKRETRFTSKCPANEIISKIEAAAMPIGFGVKKNNYKMKLVGEKTGRKGRLAVTTEIFEVAPSLCVVELRKSGGDTLEFHTFYNNLSAGLKDIVWTTGDAGKVEEKGG
ncbi:CBL-interacting serine/threonine-protein kinase 9 [Hibiscus syriacus]|uniref:non-specific serine/threonine protein kinase n=1 Tax=Hibiscus syriacus TaxID=106335 RepID=A0A6A3B170_HIBSY|nr:CBL-interacting serine/threonine-protein kinase 23-like [Hibiscus syriacus]KAE8708839.1 CBL-interacting serine/threonine-protein kinase 9 [Hibiscus syriacus]